MEVAVRGWQDDGGEKARRRKGWSWVSLERRGGLTTDTWSLLIRRFRTPACTEWARARVTHTGNLHEQTRLWVRVLLRTAGRWFHSPGLESRRHKIRTHTRLRPSIFIKFVGVPHLVTHTLRTKREEEVRVEGGGRGPYPPPATSLPPSEVEI